MSVKDKLLKMIEAEYDLQMEGVTKDAYYAAKDDVKKAQADAKDEEGTNKLNALISVEKKKRDALKILQKVCDTLMEKSKKTEKDLNVRLKQSMVGAEDDGTGLI